MALVRYNFNWSSAALFEWPLVVLGLVLATIGTGLIYSATAPMGQAGQSLVIRQVTWCFLGLVIMVGFLLVDYHILERWAIWFYVGIVVALVVVWAVGKVTAGSRRWIDLGLMRFQPSEFAKLAVVILLARYFQNRPIREALQPRELIHPLIVTAVPTVLVLVQPDLGTACLITVIAASMIVFVGLGRRAWLWVGGIVLGSIPVLLLVGDRVLKGYQKQRLITYLDPSFDPLGSGYHIIQSQIAIGSGGIAGKGFMQGTQSQLMFLPVKHTDFIFSILAEEFGFLGCMVVLILFCAFMLRGMGVTLKARDTFGALLAFGCTTIIFWHVATNIGMVMGLLPVVGVPLSFLSYGGSSLLSSFLVVAILVNVSMRRFAY